MARQYGQEKIDLLHALALLARAEPLRFGQFVERLVAASGCSERAAKDALGILRRGGYVVRGALPGDRRARLYRVSERGRALLAHPHGWSVVRLARKLFTSCPARAGARFQRHYERDGEEEGREAELARLERLLLVGSGERGGDDDGAPAGIREQRRSVPRMSAERSPPGRAWALGASRQLEAELTMLAGAAAMLLGVVSFRWRALVAEAAEAQRPRLPRAEIARAASPTRSASPR